MTKIAENGQNKEGFAVVSSQMLLGRKILCRDTVMWCRGIRKGQGPLSDPFEGPQRAPKSLIVDKVVDGQRYLLPLCECIWV